jgi:hypothetical protein
MNSKRQIFTLIILILVVIACNNRRNEKTSVLTNTRNLDDHDGYIQTTKDSLKPVLDRICKGISYEFTDLYQDTDSIPEADFMEIDNYLKNEGFEVVETGRGNWMKGPRIFSMTLRKDSCYCRIDKLYYSIENSTKLKVTERITTIRK